MQRDTLERRGAETGNQGLAEISPGTYDWSVRILTALQRILNVNIKLHASPGTVTSGEIFVFNHFARFETLVPQYLIYRECGALCRSVASRDLFQEDSALSSYLLKVGAVPNNHPKLLPRLAAEILRGRKVVIFSEGGMVKSRDVMDSSGEYSVFSRSSGRRRKHHSGAAVLAMVLDLFKAAILRAHEEGDSERLDLGVERLGLENREALLAAARRPTCVVPSNITFYPIRVDPNLLHSLAGLLNGRLSRRFSEELLIEGNILLKDTDMDVRMGDPFTPGWNWWENRLNERFSRRMDSLDAFFGLTLPESGRPLMKARLRRKVQQIRDNYTERIYAGVTLNITHIASTLILQLVKLGRELIGKGEFLRLLYLAVKELHQNRAGLNLHWSLHNPESYQDLPEGRCAGLEHFLRVAADMQLVESVDSSYRFLDKVAAEFELDEIRLKNLVVVYSNEAKPIREVQRAVERALQQEHRLSPEALARLRFEDEMELHQWDRRRFDAEAHQDVNRAETATASGEPYLLLPRERRRMAILAVHGLLASPAEMRPFSERLAGLGYPVLGVRLRGHGTSPWDLRDRTWQEWLLSVRRGYSILSQVSDQILLLGFSTGGALCLQLAADRPAGLAGVAAVAVPMRFRDSFLLLAPFLQAVDRVTSWIPALDGVRPFHVNNSEHPHINYRHIPLRAIFELRALLQDTSDRLGEIEARTMLIHGDEDPVVDIESLEVLREGLVKAAEVTWHSVPSTRHGILYENIANVQEMLLSFIQGIDDSTPAPRKRSWTERARALYPW